MPEIPVWVPDLPGRNLGERGHPVLPAVRTGQVSLQVLGKRWRCKRHGSKYMRGRLLTYRWKNHERLQQDGVRPLGRPLRYKDSR